MPHEPKLSDIISACDEAESLAREGGMYLRMLELAIYRREVELAGGDISVATDTIMNRFLFATGAPDSRPVFRLNQNGNIVDEDLAAATAWSRYTGLPLPPAAGGFTGRA